MTKNYVTVPEGSRILEGLCWKGRGYG